MMIFNHKLMTDWWRLPLKGDDVTHLNSSHADT